MDYRGCLLQDFGVFVTLLLWLRNPSISPIFFTSCSTDQSIEILQIVLTDLAIIHLDENAPKMIDKRCSIYIRVSCTKPPYFSNCKTFFDESHQLSNKGRTPQNGRNNNSALSVRRRHLIGWNRSRNWSGAFSYHSKTKIHAYTHTHTHIGAVRFRINLETFLSVWLRHINRSGSELCSHAHIRIN